VQAWMPSDATEAEALKLLKTGLYVAQEKADGKHVFGGKLNGQVMAFNRNGQVTAIEGDLMRILENIPDNTITDGERIWGGPYVIFDAIRMNGEDLMEESYEFRYAAAAMLVQRLEHPNIQIIRSASTYDAAVELIAKLKAETAEGFIIKRKDSKYLPGKRVDKTILRVKWRKEADVILFHVPNAPKRSLAMYVRADNDKKSISMSTRNEGSAIGTLVTGLRFIGDVNAYDYFRTVPEGQIRVGRVTYLYMTRDQKLNQPVIEELRDDKAPGECVFSQLVTGKRFLP